MRVVEGVVLSYCAYVIVLAVTRPLDARRRRAVLMTAALMAGAVAAAAFTPPDDRTVAVRDWLPAMCILSGYWLSGAFFIAPMTTWERRLDALDRRLGIRAPGTSAVDGVLELAYLSVYLIIPAGFAWIYFSGAPVDVDRYWTPVVAAELGCYALLPWIQMRPPRALQAVRGEPKVWWPRRVNLAVLDRGSIQANTFPSAHAAGAVATALAVTAVSSRAGVVFLIWALLIAIGSVTGRYHYAADAALGVVWALAVSAAALG